MFRIKKQIFQGFTVIEVLVVLGVLVVILSFASPSLTSTTARNELNSAIENVEFSIRTAKLTARQLESPVLMRLELDPSAKLHAIRFSFPVDSVGLKSTSLDADNLLQDYVFPKSVRLKSDLSTIRFNYLGKVETPSRILLVSSDADMKKHIVVE